MWIFYLVLYKFVCFFNVLYNINENFGEWRVCIELIIKGKICIKLKIEKMKMLVNIKW